MSFSTVSPKNQEAARNKILILKEIASSPSIRIPNVAREIGVSRSQVYN
jgi:predicted DNA-binding transcriptional regulator AlpA